MIWESWPWKQELRRLSSTIDAERARVFDMDDDEDEDEFSHFELERAVFYAAFVVRKLIENRKITDKAAGHSIEVEAFRSSGTEWSTIGDPFTAFCDLDKHYHLDQPYQIRFSPSNLAGEIIHSFKLMWCVGDDGRVTGVYLCSYRHGDDRIIYVPLETLLTLIDRIADDKVSSIKVEVVRKPSDIGDAEQETIKRTVD